MKADDFRSFSKEELNKQIADMRKQLFHQRMDLHSNQLQDTNKIRKTKRDIARAITVLGEMEKEENTVQAGEAS